MKNDTRVSSRLAVLTVVLVCLAVQSVFTLPAYSDEIIGWGSNSDGQATPPAGSNFTAIAAGSFHSLALRAMSFMNMSIHRLAMRPMPWKPTKTYPAATQAKSLTTRWACITITPDITTPS